jgi:hypothetical protein
MKKIFYFIILIISQLTVVGQGVSINDDNSAANAHAMLDLSSTSNNKGLLIPRLSSAQRIAMVIGVTDEGLLVYDETTKSFWIWDASKWQEFIIDENSVWQLSGNANIDTNSQFIGNTNNASLFIKVDNTNKFLFNKSGSFEPVNTGASIFIGEAAGEVDNLLNNQNIFIGQNSGSSNTNGNKNVAIGDNSFTNLPSCTKNVALGAYTLQYSKAYSEVAIGANALTYNDNYNDINNVAIGYICMQHSASYGTYSNHNNSSVGYRVMRGGKGVSNTFAAPSSGDNCTGIGNVALTKYALNTIQNGDYNIALGYYSASNLRNGHYNVAIGNQSGSNSRDDNDNISIGNNADPSTLNISNAISIGYNVQTDTTNNVSIGNSSITWIGGQVNWSTYSDQRFKKNITNNIPGLAFVNRLRPVTYTWDINGLNQFNGTQKTEQESPRSLESIIIKEKIVYSGFLAQEVGEAAHQCEFNFSGFTKGDNKHLFSLSYAEFTVPLVKAIQELSQLQQVRKRRIELLKEQLILQQQLISKLESKVNKMNNL